MNTYLLTPEKDPMGAAILDYARNGKVKCPIKVMSSMFDDDEMMVEHLFRNKAQMPTQEQEALRLATGKVLDVGAGAGCHALELQQRGLPVKAIDISPLSCQAMEMRGVQDVECVNLFNPHFTGSFDTILLLMNGTGLAGRLSRLPQLFNRLKELMAKGGQILIDSSDLRYIYEDEEGNLDWNPTDGYYGEVDFQMAYKDTIGDSFNWLYVDFPMLKTIAAQTGLKAELVAEGTHYDYLAKVY